MKYLLALSLLILATAWADAAEVQLRDGSVVVGTILSLADGEDLVVDTEYMDEVTIEWEAIEQIRGTQVVEVEFFDSRRVIGTVTFDDDGVSISGTDTVSVNPEDIFSISEVNETFRDALSVYTDLGTNIVRGNNQVTQLSFGAGIGYDTTKFETAVNGTIILNEQTATEDTKRTTLNANYTHKFRHGWQAIGLYQFESDEQQNLDGRSLFGGAVSKRLLNNRRHRVELFSGLAVNSEQFSGTPRNETLEGLLGARYRLRWGVDSDIQLTIFPSLEESDRVRTQLDASLSFDLLSDLDFKIIVYDRYDSQPPPGNDKNDTGLTLGLSWEY